MDKSDKLREFKERLLHSRPEKMGSDSGFGSLYGSGYQLYGETAYRTGRIG